MLNDTMGTESAKFQTVKKLVGGCQLVNGDRKESGGSDENVLYNDCSGGYTSVCICQDLQG